MKIQFPAALEGVGDGKCALVTGVFGQDGSYMTDFLLSIGYRVFGGHRASMSRDQRNVAHNLSNPRFRLVDLDITQPLQVNRALREIAPDEIYNFAALSRVGPSFDDPRGYLEANAMGVIYLTDGMAKHCPEAKLYQACTSEMWGSEEPPQGYGTDFSPDSPYAVSKLAAYWHCMGESSRGLYCAIGITSNHESPRRPPHFVTSKIIEHFARYEPGSLLELGNLSAVRDWGYAPNFCVGFWRLLQRDTPEVTIFGTGTEATVEDLLVMSAKHAGLKTLDHVSGDAAESWVLYAEAPDAPDGIIIAQSNPAFVRPNRNNFVVTTEAVKITATADGWRPTTKFPGLLAIMENAAQGVDAPIRFDGLYPEDGEMLTREV